MADTMTLEQVRDSLRDVGLNAGSDYKRAWAYELADAIDTALKAQAAEPVGWMASADLDELADNRKESENGVDAIEVPVSSHPFGHMNVPVYTHPQPAQDAKDAAPEEWRSFAEGYEVSSHGRTRSKGRLLQPYVKGKGYLAVSIWHGGKNKEMYVHRVVASAFCRRDDPSQDQVNHRDGDKLNNYASNLEWCTAKENRVHAARVLFSATRPVVGTNLKTGETITFRSLAEAEEHGFIRANIQKCIAGIRKKHGGFTWRDVDAAMAKEFGR